LLSHARIAEPWDMEGIFCEKFIINFADPSPLYRLSAGRGVPGHAGDGPGGGLF
jgi:hypothetical protein